MKTIQNQRTEKRILTMLSTPWGVAFWMTLAVFVPAVSLAQLIVYDPFAVGESLNTPGYYNAGEGTLSTHNISIGNSGSWSGLGNWGGNWVDVADANRLGFKSGGLVYERNGRELVAATGMLGRHGGNNNFAGRPFATSAYTSGILYVSFLFYIGGDIGNSYGNGIGSSTSAIQAGFRTPSSNIGRRIYPHYLGNEADWYSLPIGTHFFVLRVDITGGQMTMYLNPGLSKTEAEVNATADYDQKWVLSAGETSPSFRFFASRSRVDVFVDEFRLARVSESFTAQQAWSAVTPMVPLLTTGTLIKLR